MRGSVYICLSVGAHMWVGCVRTCVRLCISEMHSSRSACAYLQCMRATVHRQMCVCEKHKFMPTKKCFHLLRQPHTRLIGCVADTLWSLRSPQLIQEQISADTNIPTSLWEKGARRA